MATCRTCGIEGEMAKGQGNICPACCKEYHRAYQAANRDKVRAQRQGYDAERRKDPEWVATLRKRGRRYWSDLRHEVVMAYGGYLCACCGETEPAFLSIDHVFNDGAEHRRSLGYDGNGKGGSSRTLKWLKDHNFPAGFQVLCMNCNHGKARNGGVCPHKTVLRKQTA